VPSVAAGYRRPHSPLTPLPPRQVRRWGRERATPQHMGSAVPPAAWGASMTTRRWSSPRPASGPIQVHPVSDSGRHLRDLPSWCIFYSAVEVEIGVGVMDPVSVIVVALLAGAAKSALPDTARAEKLRLTGFNGPVFTAGDPEFQECTSLWHSGRSRCSGGPTAATRPALHDQSARRGQGHARGSLHTCHLPGPGRRISELTGSLDFAHLFD
jgi:hypothetical protein